jgi:hypothetical protein
MITSESILNISPALLKAQSTMGNAIKDAKNPFFKSSYADLNAVREVCHTPLNENGITVLQIINGDFVETTLLHESGEFIQGATRIVCKSQNNPQDYGSAVTYARRYGLQAFLSIGAEDDDGNRASKRDKGERQDFIVKSIEDCETIDDLNGIYAGLDKSEKTTYKNQFTKRKEEING